jgi:hypothetical protein
MQRSLGNRNKILGRESWTCFLAMDQKIPPEIFDRKEHALVGQAKMHFTVS